MTDDRSRRALVVRGGWDGHQPVQTTEHFIPRLEAAGFAVDVEESPAVYADAARMAGYDLIVQAVSMGEATDEQIAGLLRAVHDGAGFAGWHGGICDSYRNSADYLHLVGGQFACHPPKAPEDRDGSQADYFLPYRVTMLPAAAEHPITAGIGDFDVTSEQYWVLHDEYSTVLATTTHPAPEWASWNRPVTSPAIWTRQWGAGRVFVTTPGHDMDAIRIPQVTQIIERGLLWAAR